MVRSVHYAMVLVAAAVVAAIPAVVADGALHEQSCGATWQGDTVCLSNESWTAGVRAFDLLLNEPYGTSFPLWMGATSVLVNPHTDPVTGEALRDRVHSDGSINDNNYANYSIGSCDPRTNSTAGNQNQTIYYEAVAYHPPPLSSVALEGAMGYQGDGFWVTDFLYIDAFGASEFHFSTSLRGHDCVATLGDTPQLVPLAGATASDHTVYGREPSLTARVGVAVQSIPETSVGVRSAAGDGVSTTNPDPCLGTPLGLQTDAAGVAYYGGSRVAFDARSDTTVVVGDGLPVLVPGCAVLVDEVLVPESYRPEQGYVISQQALVDTGRGDVFVVPSSVEWWMRRCDIDQSRFVAGTDGMARSIDCVEPGSWGYFGEYLTVLGPNVLATNLLAPQAREVPGAGTAWGLSCLRFDAVEVLPDGTEVFHTGIVAHDWFLLLDPSDPNLVEHLALSLDRSMWYDRGDGNACPSPLPDARAPEPGAFLCGASLVQLDGLRVPPHDVQGLGLSPDTFIGSVQLTYETGRFRTPMHDRITASGVDVTAHTATDGVRSWTIAPVAPGIHHVSFDATTLCPGLYGGATEVVSLGFDVYTPGDPCDIKDASASSFVIELGVHNVPSGLSVGSLYHGGTVTHINGHPAIMAIQLAVLPTARPVFGFSVSQDANIRYCEQVTTVPELHFTPSDTYYSSWQWNMPQVRADVAWDITLGSTSRNVCVIDSGYDSSHPDAQPLVASASFLPGTPSTSDGLGHGQHVIGTAGRLNNGVGVAGMANVGMMNARVFDNSGSATGGWASIANAITWCADNGGDVISMSLGGGSPPSSVASAVDYAYTTKGLLLIASTGNAGCSGAGCVGYPAAYPKVMAVGCTDSSEVVCSFSNKGPEVELTAPGNLILSQCLNPQMLCDTAYASPGPTGDYWRMSGTSMSTPHVSGAAALIWSYVSGLSRDDLATYLRCKAQDLGSPGKDDSYGWGELDVRASLDAAIAGSCTSTPPCSGTMLLAGAPITSGSSAYGPTTVSVTHPAGWHVSGWTFVASDSATVINNPAGHDARTVYVGDGNTRYITGTAYLGSPPACTVTATWKHTN